MKKSLLFSFFALIGLAACTQPARKKAEAPVTQNTLLWKISGKGLKQPSYLFGTMHMICASDIELSPALRDAIRNAGEVYLEVDMDDMMQMIGAVTKMKMRNDTTLADLLTPAEYEKVKAYFSGKSVLPFRQLERMKPMLVQSMVMEKSSRCNNMIIMDQLVMQEAQKNDKEVKGLEAITYQISIFDSIPYRLQAQALLKMLDSTDGSGTKEMEILTQAYRNQELSKMEDLTTKEDPTISQFVDLLLYNRNANWVAKLPSLMERKSLVVAVGAGHLPGERGVINLLRKAGYHVEPVQNDMIRKPKQKEL